MSTLGAVRGREGGLAFKFYNPYVQVTVLIQCCTF